MHSPLQMACLANDIVCLFSAVNLEAISKQCGIRLSGLTTLVTRPAAVASSAVMGCASNMLLIA